MPGFTTHYLFGVRLYKHFSNQALKKVIFHQPAAYGLGLQGPDLFFYHPLSYFHRENNMGSLAHGKHGKEFFSSLLERQQQYTNPLQKEIATAYVLGFLSHYLLDLHCHPYIYARTHFQENNLSYYSCHIQLETDLDQWLLEKQKKRLPSDFPQFSTISVNRCQQHTICDLLHFAYTKTFPFLKIPNHMISQSIGCMKLGTKFLYDPFERKKHQIRKVENALIGFPILSCLIGSDDSISYPDPCNLQKKEWKNPWDVTKTSRDSFPQLMDLAEKTYFETLSQIDI